VILPVSTIRFSNGEESDGTSNAAAFFTGVVVTLKAAEPTLSAAHIRQWVTALDRRPAIATATLGTTPNQTRALKMAIETVERQRANGVEDPGVWVSSPSGSYRVRPGGVIETTGGATVTQQPATVGVHAPWRTPTPTELKNLARTPDPK
jgi:hypothetical protein